MAKTRKESSGETDVAVITTVERKMHEHFNKKEENMASNYSHQHEVAPERSEPWNNFILIEVKRQKSSKQTNGSDNNELFPFELLLTHDRQK